MTKEAQLLPLSAPQAGPETDSDAEIAVISQVLSSHDSFYEIAEQLGPDSFASQNLQIIWDAIVAVESQGRTIDKITVGDELRRAKQLTKIGGTSRLDWLLEQAPAHLGNITTHADIVADRALSRRVFRCAKEIAATTIQSATTGEDALAFAETSVLNLTRANSTGLTPLAQAVPEVLAELAVARTRLLLGHTTGLREVDEITAGVQAGQLILIAARPAMGKSALALALARNIAEASGEAVLFYSYEMSRSELLLRLLATSLGANLHELRQGRLPTEMEQDLSRYAQKLMGLPIYIDDHPPETIGRLRSSVRRTAKRVPIAAVVVDYIQLMGADGRHNGNANAEISEISRGLKLMAKELDIPVIALSQLNRSLEQRPNKRPLPSDLRDSGSLEQNADTIWFLYRDAVYHNEADDTTAELIISKQRQGPTGTVYLHFQKECARFGDKPKGFQPAPRAVAPVGGGRGGGAYF